MVAVPSSLLLLLAALCAFSAACSLAGNAEPNTPESTLAELSDPNAFNSKQDAKDSSSPCSSLTSCRTCTSQDGCGWCISSNECISGSAQGPNDNKFLLPLDLSDSHLEFDSSLRDFTPQNREEMSKSSTAQDKHSCDASSWIWLSSMCAATPPFSNSSSSGSTCVLSCAPNAAKYKQGDSCGASAFMRRNKDNWCKVNGTDYCCDNCCELTGGAIACIVILVLVFVLAVTVVCVWCCVRCLCGVGLRRRYEQASAGATTDGSSRSSSTTRRALRRDSRLQRVGVIPSSDAIVHPIQAVATPAPASARLYPHPTAGGETPDVYRI